jgi:hypothetical protein
MLRAWQGCCECGIVGRVRNATSHVAVHPTHNVGRGIDATEAEGTTRLNLQTITRCSTFTYYTPPVRLLVRLVRRIEPVSYRATSHVMSPRRGRGPPAAATVWGLGKSPVSVFAFAPLAFLGFARALWALGIGALPFRFAICFGPSLALAAGPASCGLGRPRLSLESPQSGPRARRLRIASERRHEVDERSCGLVRPDEINRSCVRLSLCLWHGGQCSMVQDGPCRGPCCPSINVFL